MNKLANLTFSLIGRDTIFHYTSLDHSWQVVGSEGRCPTLTFSGKCSLIWINHLAAAISGGLSAACKYNHAPMTCSGTTLFNYYCLLKFFSQFTGLINSPHICSLSSCVPTNSLCSQHIYQSVFFVKKRLLLKHCGDMIFHYEMSQNFYSQAKGLFLNSHIAVVNSPGSWFVCWYNVGCRLQCRLRSQCVGADGWNMYIRSHYFLSLLSFAVRTKGFPVWRRAERRTWAAGMLNFSLRLNFYILLVQWIYVASPQVCKESSSTSSTLHKIHNHSVKRVSKSVWEGKVYIDI